MVHSNLKQKIPLLEQHLHVCFFLMKHGNLKYAHSISNVIQMMGS